MKTLQSTTIDKSSWGPGPWQDEPDKKQWLDQTTWLPCLAVRHPELGHWCGYVGVFGDHPCFEKGYDDLDVKVHHGLTFAARRLGDDNNAWWFGFDCGHWSDLLPGLPTLLKQVQNERQNDRFRSYYRTLKYVEAECRRLAQQLKDIK